MPAECFEFSCTGNISAALGFAMANRLSGRPGRGIAVIGDGAMSAGMAYEAMNNAKQAGNRLVVILNDVTPARTGFEVRLLDGSVIMASRLQAGPAAIRIEDSILGPLTVPVGELVEIRALGITAAATAP